MKIFSLLLLLSLCPAGLMVTTDRALAYEDDGATAGLTPPRLSFIDGQVSYWRAGSEDWAQAQVNSALAPGDDLYVDNQGNLELQIGPKAYLRAGKESRLGFESQTPEGLRFRVMSGTVSLDMRTVNAGDAVEIGTPHGAFSVEKPGYYRVDVDANDTTFTTRRGGEAEVVSSRGESISIGPNQTVRLEGSDDPTIATQQAPYPDKWDDYNLSRTDRLLAAQSHRYMSPEIYGAEDLDQHGSWQTTAEYGPVWYPRVVSTGWAPYTAGVWMRHPHYGWTWVDSAPWGWAPYHYGRWVHVGGFWGWAPGPIVRPIYAPALVAFYGRPGVNVSISVGGPMVGWVALAWGEPLIPWWGRPGFIHRPWWGGWGGPYIVNNVVIDRRVIVDARHISVYRNARIHHAMVMVPEHHFGHRRVESVRVADSDRHLEHMRPMNNAPRPIVTRHNLGPDTARGVRPPERIENRRTFKLDHQAGNRIVESDRRPTFRSTEKVEPRTRGMEERMRPENKPNGKGDAQIRIPGRDEANRPSERPTGRDARPPRQLEQHRQKSPGGEPTIQPPRTERPERTLSTPPPVNREPRISASSPTPEQRGELRIRNQRPNVDHSPRSMSPAGGINSGVVPPPRPERSSRSMEAAPQIERGPIMRHTDNQNPQSAAPQIRHRSDTVERGSGRYQRPERQGGGSVQDDSSQPRFGGGRPIN
jgi:hypothetical protein